MPDEKPKPTKAARRQELILAGFNFVVASAPHVQWAITIADTEFGQRVVNSCCTDETCMLTKIGVALVPDPHGIEAEWHPLDTEENYIRGLLKEDARKEQIVIDDGLIEKGVLSLTPLSSTPGELRELHERALSELTRAATKRTLMMACERAFYGIGNFMTVFMVELNFAAMFGGILERLLDVDDIEVHTPRAVVGISSSPAYVDYLRDEYGDDIKSEYDRILEAEKEEERRAQEQSEKRE